MAVTTLRDALKAALDTKIGAVTGTDNTNRLLIAEAIAEAVDPHFVHEAGVAAGWAAGQILVGQAGGSAARKTLAAGSNIVLAEDATTLTVTAITNPAAEAAGKLQAFLALGGL